MQRALSVRRLLASGAMPAPPSPPAPGKGGALELQGLSRDSAAGAADGGAAGGAQGRHADVEAGVDTAGRPQAPGGGAAGDGKAPPPRGGAGRHHASASESGDELEDEEEDSEEEAREAALVQLRVEGFGAAAWRGRPKELQVRRAAGCRSGRRAGQGLAVCGWQVTLSRGGGTLGPAEPCGC
jgi:hypothetical protein